MREYESEGLLGGSASNNRDRILGGGLGAGVGAIGTAVCGQQTAKAYEAKRAYAQDCNVAAAPNQLVDNRSNYEKAFGDLAEATAALEYMDELYFDRFSKAVNVNVKGECGGTSCDKAEPAYSELVSGIRNITQRLKESTRRRQTFLNLIEL